MEHHLTFTLLAIFSLAALAQRRAGATDYAVGDEDGWNTDTNFLLWSRKYNFTVGDVIVFDYVKGQHNVYQVTEETYRSCDPRRGVIAIYSSGRDRVSLTEAGGYWFICTIQGHCQSGMKFGISVAKASLAEAPSPVPSDEPPNPGQPGNRAAAAGDGEGWRNGLAFGLAFGLFPLLNY